MCGRFTLARVADVPSFFELDERPEIQVRYNIAPSQDVFSVLPAEARVGRFMKWGLVSSSAPASPLSPLINARAETVDRKAPLRDSFRARRCLIPADGFYEWRRERGFRQPFHFRLKSRGLFAFAGLWDRSTDSRGGDLETFTILTTAPNDLIADIHDRMPVILDRSVFELWLDCKAEAARLQSILEPFPADRMERAAVNPALNRTDFDSPECLDPPPPRLRNLNLFD